MIRELNLICSKCSQEFIADGKIFYQDNFLNTAIKDIKLICPSCIHAWEDKWQISSARFYENDYSLYVDIVLKNGTSYKHLDATPMDDIIVTTEEMPLAAKQKLFFIYEQWYEQKRENELKNCFFNDIFMKTTFTCETYGGEKYSDIAFRFNLQGQLETEKVVPDYIKLQIIAAWHNYESQNKQ